YLASHPLAEYEQQLTTCCSHTTGELSHLEHRTKVTIGGMLSSIKYTHTKNPRPGQTQTKYVMFDLEDVQGLIRCIMWPEPFARFGHLVQPDAILVVQGSVDRRPGSEETNLIVDELVSLEEMNRRSTRGALVRIAEAEDGLRQIQQLYEIVRRYPGEGELELQLRLEDGTSVHCQCDDLKVDLNAEMRARIEALVGRDSFVPLTARPTAVPPPGSARRQPARV
ncbi:MAG: DNA polymerase III subunit alpha, partial [Planctomycetales bacterium]|nr:DNA polymerase III subunit alpha [Planctomycetales bacterium]